MATRREIPMPHRISCTVFHRARLTAEATDSWVTKLSPQLPRTNPETQCQYWDTRGWSSPNSCFARRIAPGSLDWANLASGSVVARTKTKTRIEAIRRIGTEYTILLATYVNTGSRVQPPAATDRPTGPSERSQHPSPTS